MNKEQTIAEAVVKWLQVQHWDVYQEVQCSQYGVVADIVAVRKPLVWIIECKNSLSLSVINQAYKWHCLMRSIAVPRLYGSGTHSNRRFAYSVCAKFEIGVLEVDSGEYVQQIYAAPILRNYREFTKHYIVNRLHDGHKTSAKAGSSNGGHWTPYRETMNNVKTIIEKNPGITIKGIMEQLEWHHYCRDASAKSAIPKALRAFESWCRVDTTQRPARFYVRE